MLRKSGTWNDMVEEMKARVLKVAAESYREKRRAALDSGKFEFCNDLYISLAEVIYNTLKELITKKRELKEVETVKDIDRLRTLADEYEVYEDWTSAYRCHQERLTGDNMKNPDLWFEFGCFCMRVRPKDHGKAEECWREALTLNKNHLFSLQALGCLMWHRGYLTQAEVLLRSAIDAHSLEEYISWVLVSQVYGAQGKADNERACLRRAEKLYNKSGSRNYRTQYSPPHQLLSPLLQFPFSLAHIVHTTKKTSSVFIDAILFLLDLQLPTEAQNLLKLDSDIYSCTLDNKWCRMRASELAGDLEGAESYTKEALAISKEHDVTWMLSGHLRYSFKPTIELPAALQGCLWKGAIDAYSKYNRYWGVQKDMYQHVYLEIGMAYFKLSEFDQARKTFLRGCTVKPTSPSLWLAAGIAYYFLGDMKHAELALVEGNVLDVQNFQIWAYLTLVCLRMGRVEEAENSFQQALKTSLDPQLLAIIAEHFSCVGNFRDAETAFTESLKLKEVAGVRFNRADMYFKTGKLLEAKKDYNMVVKLPDVEPLMHSTAISRLTELQDVTEPVPVNRYPQHQNYEV
ncbi:hypothetical protein R1flu_003696 [Riccia fluitans]|uniref:Uncharacterized protein n=1 Tax=Riccia fluitans TaxID=41844 RepID=A0ABD1YA25_9MARC